MSAAMNGKAMPCHRVRRVRLKPNKVDAAATAECDLHKWQEDAASIPFASKGAVLDPLEETRALLLGIESMVALSFEGAQADAVLCMVTTAQKQVDAAVTALDRHTSAL